MSLNTTTKLNCDHHGCSAEIQYGFSAGTRAKEARELGWTVNIVAHPGGTRVDYCPRHAKLYRADREVAA